MRKSSDFLAVLLTAFSDSHLLFFPWRDKPGYFCWELAGAEGRFHVTGAWGDFPSLQCSSCAKAAFMSMKVRDLKQYEVGLEVTLCRRVYQTLVRAQGTVLQNSATKHPSL